MSHKTLYADDDKESVRLLLRLRLPPLVVGLVLGIGVSVLTSRFEEALAANVKAAFFIPFVVYIAAAVGAQTQTIYGRDLRSGHTKFLTYLFKESALGLLLGVLFGAISWGVTRLWLADPLLAMSIGIAVACVVALAPLIALITTELLNDFHEDPAVSSGPIATVIQDAVSILIYGAVLSLILL
ncbi:magnesium transporter [Candidatus Uhrbacteria bacterium]|nr:magnesium transporter [Candidatus Uhrbacteria bacterium]